MNDGGDLQMIIFYDGDMKVTADRRKVEYFSLRCPRGILHERLPIRCGGNVHNGWEWDQNFDAPTLKPSIWVNGCCHGFIRKGVYVPHAKHQEGEVYIPNRHGKE